MPVRRPRILCGHFPRLFVPTQTQPEACAAMRPGGKPSSGSSASAAACAEAMAADLLEEYWYFCNVLSSIPAKPPTGGSAATSRSDMDKEVTVPGKSAGEGPVAASPATRPGEDVAPTGRSLLRTPSLPPRMGREKPGQEGVCSHKAGGGKLRHSYSNLESVLAWSPSGSQHHPSLKGAAHGSLGRHHPPRDSRVESIIRYVNSHHRAITRGSSCRSRAFQVKNWRSLSDLETEEVQGFKDLGFVFDEEVLSPGVLDVIPGLRGGKPAEEGGGGGGEGDLKETVRRPYLSEAWLMQRSAPPALDWVGGGDAADVKEQLRFWAQVVASNVRQECC